MPCIWDKQVWHSKVDLYIKFMKPVWTVERLTSSAKKHLLIKFGVSAIYGIQTPRISWNKLELNIMHTAQDHKVPLSSI